MSVPGPLHELAQARYMSVPRAGTWACPGPLSQKSSQVSYVTHFSGVEITAQNFRWNKNIMLIGEEKDVEMAEED